MKHIKTYENLRKYNPGDYIVIDLTNKDLRNFLDTEKTIIRGRYSNVAKIEGLEDETQLTFIYKVIFSNDYHFNVSLEEIERLATPEEIEKFNLENVIPKYNL